MDELVAQLRDRMTSSPVSKDVMGKRFRAVAPCSGLVVGEVEDFLGFFLPPILRAVYTKVANGGFGPGYGVMGVRGGFEDDRGHTVEDSYRWFCEPDPYDPTWAWNDGWLPFCHYGCGVYSVVDCSADEFAVYSVDPGSRDNGAAIETVAKKSHPSMNAWLAAWLSGKIV